MPVIGSTDKISDAEDCQYPGSPSDERSGMEKHIISPTVNVVCKNNRYLDYYMVAHAINTAYARFGVFWEKLKNIKIKNIKLN